MMKIGKLGRRTAVAGATLFGALCLSVGTVGVASAATVNTGGSSNQFHAAGTPSPVGTYLYYDDYGNSGFTLVINADYTVSAFDGFCSGVWTQEGKDIAIELTNCVSFDWAYAGVIGKKGLSSETKPGGITDGNLNYGGTSVNTGTWYAVR